MFAATLMGALSSQHFEAKRRPWPSPAHAPPPKGIGSPAKPEPKPEPKPKRMPKKLARQGPRTLVPKLRESKAAQQTGAALRSASEGAADCVEPGRPPTRVFLKVTVLPNGSVKEVVVETGDATSSQLVECVQDLLMSQSLPPYPGTQAQVFSLSLSL